MLKLNINDLVHIMKQIKIAENHVATGQLVDHLGNPLDNLVPSGLRTVNGEFNNLVNLSAGAADQLMPRLSNATWNAAEANPRTGAAIKIKAARVPKFRPGKALKDALN